MALSGQQIQELQNAFISAFPDRLSLEQMLLYELEKKLSEIAGEGNLKNIIFKLIQIANAQGWIESLVCAAYNHNSGNQELQIFIQKISLRRGSDLRKIIEEWLEFRYGDLEQIGIGAFGITYRARLNNQQKYVVIKSIKFDELYEIIRNDNYEPEKKFSKTIKSFDKEAEFLSSLKHKNIVKYDDYIKLKLNLVINKKQDNTLYSVYELELPFLIMEYIEGENLENYVKENSPLKEKEALNYIQQIAEALIVVHDNNILHRDIKPKNIMLQKDKNEAVLIDFGIAREIIPGHTQTRTVSRTPGYAPPEQFIAEAPRGKYTDIYALAATLYYLLTGKHPIDALNRRNELLEEPKRLNHNISDRLNKAILWGMELEHIKRPQTVQQWLEKLYYNEQINTGSNVRNTDIANPHDGLNAKLQKFLTRKVRSISVVLMSTVTTFKAYYQGFLVKKHHLRFIQFLAILVHITCLIEGFLLWQKVADFIVLLLVAISSILLSLICIYYAWYWRQKSNQITLQRMRRLALVLFVAIPMSIYTMSYRHFRYINYYNRGFDYYFLKEYDRAIPEFTQAIKLNPHDDNIYYYRGLAYSNLKEYDLVISNYTQAIKLNPNDSRYYNNRGKAYLELQKYNLAISDFSRAIKTAFNTSQIKIYYSNRASTFDSLKDYENALADYNKLIEINPKNAGAYNNRGNVYSKLKKYENALADYNKSIQINPKCACGYINRGNVYYELKKYENALVDYNKSIQINPRCADAYNGRGNVYYELKKYENALVDYNKSIEIDPKNAYIYNNRGNVYSKLKKYENALVDYNKSIQINPKYADAYNGRGNVYYELKKYENALVDYNKSIEINPKYAYAYNGRGNVYYELKKYENALVDYNKSIEINPKYAYAYNNRGNVYSKLKNYNRANSDYEQAIKIDSSLVK